ncbi:ATP-binding protein [Falsiroseomonas sp. CW058]|uniref:ATP-binding protein n=1 Tax=Falsiroseomonas sp. CW058 TaxID=3388664 RepID=UPI003D3166E6
MPPDALAITVPPEAEAVARILDAIEAWTEAEALPPATAHRVGVVVEELAANVAMHGTGGADGASLVAVTLRREGGLVVATVEDDGRAFDPLLQAPPDTDAPLDERDPGGLGLHFARRMTRDLRYAREAGRNRVTAVFDAG